MNVKFRRGTHMDFLPLTEENVKKAIAEAQ
jgi:hypothetical protein